MIKTMAVYKDGTHAFDVSIEELNSELIDWVWVDFEKPEKKEIDLLRTQFQFDEIAIKHCVSYIERPKMDYYDGYRFIILQSLQENMEQAEIDLFLSHKYIVSFCFEKSNAIQIVWNKLKGLKSTKGIKPERILYHICDEIVDKFFPIVQKIEDDIEEIDELGSNSDLSMIDGIKTQLSKLSKVRKTVKPTKDLIYRILNSTHVEIDKETTKKLRIVYEHLVKLLDDIEDNREMANDIRESYISTNSHKMNKTMKMLTSVSIVFMPLTFIVGVYGMNFVHIPELQLKYGYYYCWVIMLLIVIGLVMWFKKKDWF
ncbi:magnesium/cobalt transporter CorA [Bacillus sp. AFS053548]|uniref:magnesium/cobalt transporter CorA n=1 Tax=Bacillus sp. AFS053548 TaxID=2033505 RepID=UPI000BFCADA3|nr:magnesium/cobalt transporter CorA [Bacillus sp. AFS053548]PGM49038.1 magnesium and cobalt transport protein CorA [Bacillus sp. AFS053548]